jgi:hypothetical protein
MLIFHAPGGVSFRAVSIETNRCLSKSSSASMKSCGIPPDTDSRMRRTRRSRSGIGSASISLRICSAVIATFVPINHLFCSRAIPVPATRVGGTCFRTSPIRTLRSASLSPFETRANSVNKPELGISSSHGEDSRQIPRSLRNRKSGLVVGKTLIFLPTVSFNGSIAELNTEDYIVADE